MAAAHVTWFDRSKQTRAKTGLFLVQPTGAPAGRPTGRLTAGRPTGVGTTTGVGAAPGATFASPVVRAARIALEALDVLTPHLVDVAHDFRAGRVDRARQGLRQALRILEVLVTIGSMTGPASSSAALGPAAVETARAIDRLLDAELAGDREATVDAIDRLLAGALAEWRACFDSLLGPPDPPPSAA